MHVLLRYALSIFLIIFSGSVYAKDILTWSVYDWPPLMILTEESRPSGIAGEQLKMFEKALADDYISQFEELSSGQLWLDLKQGRHLCSILMFKTAERENYVIFSLPTGIVLPHRVIVRKAQYEVMGRPSSISLNDLVTNNQYHGQLVSYNSYSALIDSIIMKQASNIDRLSISNTTILKMLLLGKMDYTIEYPVVVKHFLSVQNIDPHALISIPIEESLGYNYSYIACPKNDWGEHAIKKINKAIKHLGTTEKYINLLKLFAIDKADMDVIERMHNKEFIHKQQ